MTMTAPSSTRIERSTSIVVNALAYRPLELDVPSKDNATAVVMASPCLFLPEDNPYVQWHHDFAI